MMAVLDWIGFLQILLASGRPTQDYARVKRSGSLRTASDTRDMPKEVATQMAGGLGLSEDYRLPLRKSIKKATVTFVPVILEPRGEKQRMLSEGLTPSLRRQHSFSWM